MNKLYVKLDASGYVSDAVYYQPGDYTEFLGEEKPNDLLTTSFSSSVKELDLHCSMSLAIDISVGIQLFAAPSMNKSHAHLFVWGRI